MKAIVANKNMCLLRSNMNIFSVVREKE